MAVNLVIDKERFDRDGYFLIKNVFTKEEIAEIRKDAYTSFEADKKKNITSKLDAKLADATYGKGDMLSKPLLRHLVWDERILQIARGILGGEPVYYGDSNYHFGTGLRGYHRDNVDRKDLTAPDWQGDDYSIVRMGIYLQDHKKYSGGLKLKLGSHKNPTGKVVFVDSEIGDVAIWSLKTLHSGNAVRLKIFKNISINRGGLEGMVPAFLREEQQMERVAIFMTYALKSRHLDRYIEKHMVGRADILDSLKASRFDPKVLEEAKQHHLEVLRLTPEYGTLEG